MPEARKASSPAGAAHRRSVERQHEPSGALTAAKWLLIAGGIALAIWFMASVLLLIFAAVLVAITLRAPARWLAATTGIPVGVGVGLIAVGVVALLGLGIWWGGPEIGAQADQLWQQLQSQFQSIRERLDGTAWGERLTRELSLANLMERSGGLTGTVANAALTTFGLIGSLAILLFTALYLAIDPALYSDGALRLLPVRYRPRGAEILRSIGETLRWWLIGRAITMAVVTALSFAGLLALGVPLALVLAIIAGLLNFIPYIGALAGAVPAVIVAFGQGPTQALWVVLLFTAIQTVEGYLLTPLIQRRAVSLPPVVTILSLTTFGALFGFFGLLLAPALAAAMLVAVRMAYVEDVLGDRGGRKSGKEDSA